MTAYTTITSPLNDLLLVGEETSAGMTLTSLSMTGQKNAPTIRPVWRADGEPFTEVIRQLEAYFADELAQFDIQFTPGGTDFQQRVWRALEEIPYGTTTTYGALAEQLGLPRDRIQALAAAIGANPLLLVRPCHRVIGADGSMRGYAAGVERKVHLLTHEGSLHLLPTARDWATKLGKPAPWPDSLGDWLRLCHEAGQSRSAQILLRYGPGDWNALHRDVFGDMLFPLQVVIGLDTPGSDFTGGEFLMTEQRPRAQSRGSSTTLPQGHGLVFTTRDRPVATKRGWSNGPMRHGVSTIRSGRRHTLGLVFHDAA